MIKVEHLTKYYGDFLAIDDLSFDIEKGRVYGFLGPNGAGKTTTMNIMTGCLSATSGQVLIDGYDIFEEADEAKRKIGYLPEQPPLYMQETPKEYLQFVGEAKGLKGQVLHQQVEAVIETARIKEVQHRRISDLSKGYKQRVGIAQALLGNPEIIILDEPTVGLDPIQIIEIRDLIQSLGKEHTVILSSHILSEVQAICEKILIISHGKLVAFDETGKLERNLLSTGGINLTVDKKDISNEEIRKYLEALKGIREWNIDSQTNAEYFSINLVVDAQKMYAVSRQVFIAFAESGVPLLEMRLQKANLEDVFLELTDENMSESTEEV